MLKPTEVSDFEEPAEAGIALIAAGFTRAQTGGRGYPAANARLSIYAYRLLTTNHEFLEGRRFNYRVPEGAAVVQSLMFVPA